MGPYPGPGLPKGLVRQLQQLGEAWAENPGDVDAKMALGRAARKARAMSVSQGHSEACSREVVLDTIRQPTLDGWAQLRRWASAADMAEGISKPYSDVIHGKG